MVRALMIRSAQSMIPPADRQLLSHRNVILAELGKPDCLHESGNRPVRAGHRQAGKRGWRKRMPDCNDLDTDLFLTAKASPLPTGALWQDNL